MAGPLQRLSHTGAAVSSALAGNLSISALAFTLTVNSGWPTGAGGPFGVVIDPGLATEEHLLCASQASGNVVVTATGRGYDGTIAYSHQMGAVVEHIILAVEVDDANAHIYDQTRRDHSMYAPLDGSAHFTGLVTFNAGITDTGPLTQTGPVNITGNETVSGTLAVGGTAATGPLTVTGGATTDALTVTGTAAAGALTVSGAAAVTGNATVGGTLGVTGAATASIFDPVGLAGATAASRYVGATAVGPPTTGTFLAGDWVSDQTGAFFVCLAGGSPGTWSVPVGGVVGTVRGPTAGFQVVNASLPFLTLAVPLVNGRQYEVTATIFGTIITAVPAFVNATITDTGPYVASNYFMSYNSTAYVVGSVLCGSGSFPFTAGATGTDTFTLNVQSSGAGAGFKCNAANQASLIIRRTA